MYFIALFISSWLVNALIRRTCFVTSVVNLLQGHSFLAAIFQFFTLISTWKSDF